MGDLFRDMSHGQQFLSATCYIKFSCFEILRHEEGQNEFNIQCRIVCTKLENSSLTTHLNSSICFE